MGGTGSTTGTGASTVRHARDALRAQDARAHAARIARLSPVPLVGWLAFLPFDVTLTRLIYPESTLPVVIVRGAVGVALAVVYVVVRTKPPRSELGIDLLIAAMMAVLCGAIGVICTYCGGLSSVHGAGALIVMSAPSFIELPWRRGLRVAFAGWIAFIAVTLGALVVRQRLDAELDGPGVIVFSSYVLMLLTMGTIAVVGGHLGHRLRQQVYESRSIGRYKLEKLLGRGGMGEVWAAYHQGLRRNVALKILRDAGPQASSRFEREVQTLAELRHPNTVRVFDYGSTDDGLLYYAMELLSGVDLGALVKRTGPLSPARAVHIVLQASRALGEAHQKGMVHRDVKPENLFLASAGGEADFVKVLDFGIVRLERDGSETLTQQGHLAGTPAFMAPEVGLGADADPRADVYALGAVLYFLLTGAPPFEAKGAAAMLAAHQLQPIIPPSLRMARPLPADVEKVVLLCLSKTPDERPADAAALAEILATTAVAKDWRPEDGTIEPESLASEDSDTTRSQADSADVQTRKVAKPVTAASG